MTFRRSDTLPSRMMTLTLDEIPELPPSPVIPKVIPFDDISCISQISDMATEADTELSPLNQIPNYDKIHKQFSKFSQNQSTSLNAGSATGRSESAPLKSVQSSESKPVQILDVNVPLDVRECLKRQEEKWNTLQEQVSRILEQKTTPCSHDCKTALVLKNDFTNLIEVAPLSQTALKEITLMTNRNSSADESKENSQLCSYLLAQNQQIQKLQVQNQTLQEQKQKVQEQNQTLLEHNLKLQEQNQDLINMLLSKSELKTLNKADCSAEQVHSPNYPNGCPFDEETEQLFLGTKNKQNGTVECHQQTEIKKISTNTKQNSNDITDVEFCEENQVATTSTSTMTSWICDGNDKLVYQKLHTVITDIKKQRKEVSAQCSLNKEIMDTPKNQTTPKLSSSSSRRKKGKCRKCGKCSPHNHAASANAPIAYPSTSDNPEDGKTQFLPYSVGETRPKVQENDEERNERNVNQLNLSDEVEETYPRIKAVLRSTSNGREKHTPSPKAVNAALPSRKSENRRHSDGIQSSSTSSDRSTDPVKLKLECRKNRRHSDQRQFSSTSSDSNTQPVNIGLEHRKHETPRNEPEFSEILLEPSCLSKYSTEQPSAISIYGLSSPNLSAMTKQYLDNYGLVRDRNHDGSGKSSGKCRTTVRKQYLR